MRLIDKDALIDEIKHTLWDWDSVDGIMSSTVLKQTISDINNMPTIDAEPIRHGKWIKVGDNTYRCSRCNEVSCCNGNFCTDCGARMEGVEE